MYRNAPHVVGRSGAEQAFRRCARALHALTGSSVSCASLVLSVGLVRATLHRMQKRCLGRMCCLLVLAACGSNRPAICTNTDERWRALVERSNSCEQDSDCSNFEHGEYCSCAFLVQTSVNRSALPIIEA